MANRSITRRRLIQLASGTGVSLGLGWNPLAAQSGEIITRPIPSSGEAIPAVGIGTNRYKVGTPEQNAGLSATLAAFAEMGGQVVDTAPVYRSSETILGQLIAELDNRDRLFIATKIEKKDRAGSLERMEGSLVKLQTPVLDLVQSHQMNGAENTLPVMREWQEAGRVRYVGITTSDTDTFPRMLELMNKETMDFIQVNYSLSNREAADEILPLAEDKGIAVLVNIPLARGQLFKAVADRPLPDWTTEFDCESWGQFFLKYVISHPAVTCAIPGATKAKHAIDNVGAAYGRLPDPELRRRQETFFDAL
jgi:aryl-alcohol dehydrogenase-like predicted oxidoreductase